MAIHYLGIGVRAEGLPAGEIGDAPFEAMLDNLVDEFATIGYPDADYTGSLATREAEILLGVDESSENRALFKAIADLRTVLHALHVPTADWPDLQPLIESVRHIEPGANGRLVGA